MSAAAPKLTFIPDLLDEHFEELQFLWAMRERALCSPHFTVRRLADLDERIAGRLDGLRAQPDHARPLLDAGLASDDPAAVRAAALALLDAGTDDAVTRVLDTLARARHERLDALRRALCVARYPRLVAPLDAMLGTADGIVAATIAEVLAVQTATAPAGGRLDWFLRDDDPIVRTSAWRIVAELSAWVDAKMLATAVRDDDPAVRRTALHAAAWTRNPGVLALGRHVADAPAGEHLDALYLLAVLGAPDDLPRIAAVVDATSLGVERFRIAGAFGHPALVEVLLAAMTNPDPATAAAAGEAFAKITGEDVDSGRRVTAAPAPGEEPDEFEAEFLDEFVLPDPECAARVWAEVRGRHAGAVRLCRGHDVNRQLTREAFVELDLESRNELFLRARFGGTWHGTPSSLECFPQRH